MGIYWGSLHVSRKWGQMQDYHTVKVVIGKRPEAFYVHLDLWKAGKNVWTCCIWHDLTDMFNWVESTWKHHFSSHMSGSIKIPFNFFEAILFVWNIYIKSSILEILFSIVSFLSPTKPTPLWPLTFSAFMPWILWRARRAFSQISTDPSDVESDSFGWKVTYLLQDVQWFFRNMDVEVMKNDFLLSEMVVIFGECGSIWAP